MAQITKKRLNEFYNTSDSIGEIAKQITLEFGVKTTTADVVNLWEQVGLNSKDRKVKRKRVAKFEIVDEVETQVEEDDLVGSL